MCKTILIPTQFNSETISLIKQAIEDHQNEKIDIVLVHGIHASDSITDLLFGSKRNMLEKLTNTNHEESKQFLLDHYNTEINSLRTELFSGFTQAAFQNFLDGNNIQKIYCYDAKTNLKKVNYSADLSKFIKRSKIEKISLNNSNFNTQFSTLSHA